MTAPFVLDGLSSWYPSYRGAWGERQGNCRVPATATDLPAARTAVLGDHNDVIAILDLPGDGVDNRSGRVDDEFRVIIRANRECLARWARPTRSRPPSTMRRISTPDA